MNIFAVYPCPRMSARALCNKHIVKMICESTLMLEVAQGLKKGYANHPCTLWTAASQANYDWLAEHAWELSDEYTRRYGKIHKYHDLIQQLSTYRGIQDTNPTDHPQCMPEEFRGPDTYEAYRRMYIGSKLRFCKWMSVDSVPDFVKEHCVTNGIDINQFVKKTVEKKHRSKLVSQTNHSHNEDSI